MKRFFTRFIFLLLAVVICVSCRNVVKYIDDGGKYIGDVIDGKKPIRIKSIVKDCPYCDGGYYWYNGYQYECSHCGGDGWIVDKI